MVIIIQYFFNMSYVGFCMHVVLQHAFSFFIHKTNKYAKCDQKEGSLCSENKDLTVT